MTPRTPAPNEATARAAERISAAFRARSAYNDGLQDGALTLIAYALGIEQTGVQQTVFGHGYTLTLEWTGEPPSGSFDTALRMAVQRSLARSRERIHPPTAPPP